MAGEDLKAIAFHLADGGGHDIDHTSINENTSFYDFHRVVCKLKFGVFAIRAITPIQGRTYHKSYKCSHYINLIRNVSIVE